MNETGVGSLRFRSATFGGVASTVVIAAALIVRTTAFARRPDLLSTALAIDLCVTVPIAWALLLVRPGLARPGSIVLVMGLGALTARLVLPASEHALALGARLLTAPAELALTGYAVVRLRRHRRARRAAQAADESPGDLLEGLEQALGSLGASGRLAAYELATMVYALRPRRARAADGAATGDHAVDARGWGGILAALAMAIVAEMLPVHMLVAQWSVHAAWAFTALSAYSLVWFIGDWRAVGARASAVSASTFRLRVGMRWSADIPLADIAGAERATWRTARDPELLNALKPLQPNVIVRLRRPTRLRGPFGVARRATVLGLRFADPDRFLAALPLETPPERG